MDAETQDLLRQFAREEGAKYQLPPDYIDAVLNVESSGGQDRTSLAGARGPMQLMPDTAKRLGVNIDDPVDNVRGGIQELASLRDRFGGDLVKAYAGYNSNPDLVEQRLAHGGFDGLPGETRRALVKLFDQVPHLIDNAAPQQAALAGPAAPAVAPPQAPRPLPLPRMAEAANPVQQAPPRTPMQLAGDLAASQQPLPSEQTGTWSQVPGAALDIAETVAPFVLPVGETAAGAGLITGAFSAATAARRAIAGHIKSSGWRAVAEIPEAVASLDSNDLTNIGVATGLGAFLGAATHGIARALTGPAAEIPPPPELPVPPIQRALPEVPESLPVPKPPTVRAVPPVPQPQIPTDEEVAALTAREAQTEAKNAAAAKLGVAPNASNVAQAARAAVPQPNKPEVDAAYAALRTARGETPVNVTGIRARLRTAGIDPGELGLGGEQFEAPLQETLDALSRVNQQRFRTITQTEGGGFRGGELRILSAQLYDDVAAQLSEPEQALLAKATDAARTNGQIRRLQALIDTTQKAGTPQGARGLDRLLNKPQYWRTKLGDDLYDYGVDWFTNLSKLQETPVGERVVTTIARETTAYRDAIATHGSQVAEVGRRNAEAATAYADKLTEIEAQEARRLAQYRGRVDLVHARNSTVAGRYADRVARAQAAYEARVAAITPPGASPIVRGIIQAPFGAAAGAMAAHGLGLSPKIGAIGGALGFGVPNMVTAPLLDPIFGAGFRFLAAHPQGTQQWFQTAGRLTLQAMIQRDALTPTPQAAPQRPYPIGPSGPRPLGRVAAP